MDVKKYKKSLFILSFIVTKGFTESLSYHEVKDRVEKNYVEKVDDQKIIQGSIQGMLESLDPYSTYYTPEKLKAIQEQTQGTYGGVGLEVFVDKNVAKIASVLDKGPSDKAGLKTDDLIMAVNQDYNLDSIGDKLRGKPGTTVNLLIKRGKQSLNVTLVRERIHHHPVKFKVIHVNKEISIGHIRISTFNKRTTQEVKLALASKKLQGLIVDVRYNSGGLFHEGINVCRLFIKEGTIASTKGRQGTHIYRAKGHDIIQGLPMVILINSGTASAAEIFAGALQDHNRALVMGTRSFGKGSVQTVFPLSSGGAIKMTTAYYYTPLNRSIHKKGIVPDVDIQQTFDQGFHEKKFYSDIHEKNTSSLRTSMNDNQLDEALKIIQAMILKSKIPALGLI